MDKNDISVQGAILNKKCRTFLSEARHFYRLVSEKVAFYRIESFLYEFVIYSCFFLLNIVKLQRILKNYQEESTL